jgi:hypothetical protein
MRTCEFLRDVIGQSVEKDKAFRLSHCAHLFKHNNICFRSLQNLKITGANKIKSQKLVKGNTSLPQVAATSGRANSSTEAVVLQLRLKRESMEDVKFGQ